MVSRTVDSGYYLLKTHQKIKKNMRALKDECWYPEMNKNRWFFDREDCCSSKKGQEWLIMVEYVCYKLWMSGRWQKWHGFPKMVGSWSKIGVGCSKWVMTVLECCNVSEICWWILVKITRHHGILNPLSSPKWRDLSWYGSWSGWGLGEMSVVL